MSIARTKTADSSEFRKGAKNQISIIIHIDGASRGNPGYAGAGAIIKNSDGIILKKLTKYLGIATNNIAEYNALLLGLQYAKKIDVKSVKVYSDSELLVKQMNGEYRVKHPEIIKMFQKVMTLSSGFDKIIYTHIPRESNRDADLLANMAIDAGA